MLKITKYASFSRQLPSFLYKILAQSWIDYEFPRHIFVETTAHCNLSCEYCPREKIKEHMDYELFKQIIDECDHHGSRSFSLHLFGEPLLYPKILDAIGYIRSKTNRHTILLTTNGTHLNKFAGELDKLEVDRIIWSWRGNNFNSDTLSILKKRGLIRFLIEETPKGEIEKWKGFNQEVKHLHNYGGNIDVGKWGIQNNEVDNFYPCYHLWLAPAIRWNGEITICCNDPLGKESVGIYGNGLTIASYWKSNHLLNIRESHRRLEPKGICTNCNVWKTYPDLFFKHQKINVATSSNK